ncbi:MAG: N-6 DNA methylase [Planctomycetota bacterium]|nr:N-6 DNA methylase [Planctomycetota bacterium]
MARRKNDPQRGLPNLYEEQARIEIRRLRRQRALFIPKFLTQEAASPALAGPERDHAYKIAMRWAEMETTGALAQATETSIDSQFLTQLFGEGLGYTDKTRTHDTWHLEREYAVQGVGSADGALGDFPHGRPRVVIELKDALTDLDRDRSNGRTAVQQCWDYLNALPDCPWGIVSNFATVRLYHRGKGIHAYEEFSLQELRDPSRFDEFYCLFERGGLLATPAAPKPRALALLERTQERQKDVGDDLYNRYQLQRLLLIEHLEKYEDKPLDEAIRIAQKLLDRLIFVAFCEDRELLPRDCLKDAYEKLPAFSKVRNPRWHNLLNLFRAMDEGSEGRPPISRFNGGLFALDPALDDLQLRDDEWAHHFKGFGDFDFTEEVNVEVLGHLFERSITELEKLRVGGLFALKSAVEGGNGNGEAPPRRGRRKARKPAPKAAPDTPLSRMPKSAQRKRFGIYYTPPAFTGLIVERTVDALVAERFAALAKKHKVDPEARENQKDEKLRAYWRACLETLETFAVCDPACGSGAFLIRAYDALDAHYKTVIHGLAGAGEDPEQVNALEESIPDRILERNLYGVDLSLEGVEITQLALWIRSARKGKTLTDLSSHIVQGNSLVSDPAVHPKALDWPKTFPAIFERGGFDCVIGNPPWERVKVQDREFFSLTDPETAGTVNAADRKKRIEKMPKDNPALHQSYLQARDQAQKMLDYARLSEQQGGRFPLTGKGDINLYMLFAEHARSLVAPTGRVGLLVPSGIATDDTTKEFFSGLMNDRRLVSLYDFENKEGHFEDVHRSFKFTALVFGGTACKNDKADFVFFAHAVEEVAEVNKQRHIPLTAADMKLLNPNTRTCPIFRTRRDAELTRAIYRRVPILIDENRKQGGNPWEAKFFTMFHQTNDAKLFHPASYWEMKKYKLEGNVYKHGKKRALPLYEAKMVQAFDHRAASVVVEEENWVRQGQKAETSLVEYTNPEFAVMPRWWVDEKDVLKVSPETSKPWFLAYKDITSATNERTMIAAFLPSVAVVNSAPLIFVGPEIGTRREACLLANLNAFAFDFVARQKVGSVHLNFFIVEQLPTLPPGIYADKCPWAKRETLEHWISERVLKLSCTAEDMKPLAEACGFKGSRGDGVHLWKEAERAELRAELDAAYFHLYGTSREDAEYILTTFNHTGLLPEEARNQTGNLWESQGIGQRTLDAYDRLAQASAAR